MNCSLCGKPFADGDKVEVTFPAEIVGGVPQQVEEDSVHHEVCDEED